MLFQNNGEFIDEIDFSDVVKEDEDERAKKNLTTGILGNLGINSSINKQESNEVDQDKEDDEDDEQVKINKKKEESKINGTPKYDKFKRMELIKMSNNNKYFMFYDNKSKNMKIYEIKKVENEGDEANN